MSNTNTPDNLFALLWHFFRLDKWYGKVIFFPLALLALALFFKLIPFPNAGTEACGGRATIVGTLLHEKMRTPLAGVTAHFATFAKDETDAHGTFSVEGVELPESKIVTLRVEFPGGKQLEVEGMDLRNTVKYPIRDCKIDLGQILVSPENAKHSNATPAAPTESLSRKPDAGNGQSTPPSSSAPALFNSEKPTAIALLAAGQPDGLSLSTLKNSLVEQWQEEGIAVSTSLLRPDFYARLGHHLENEDLAALKASGLDGRAACLCFLKIGNIRTGSESLETGGEVPDFQKAGGDLEVKFFALRANIARSFTISETGAGGNRARALESLNSKFVTQFFNHKLPLALCKN
ncbi:MAG: hypothetical protein ABMA02_01125 [Saprospiraceae bacterium]